MYCYTIHTTTAVERALFEGLRETLTQDRRLAAGEATDFGVIARGRTEGTTPLSPSLVTTLQTTLEQHLIGGQRDGITLGLSEPLGLDELKQIERIGGRLVRHADPRDPIRVLSYQNLVRILHYAGSAIQPETPDDDGEDRVRVLSEEESRANERLNEFRERLVSEAIGLINRGMSDEELIVELAGIPKGGHLHNIQIGAIIDAARADDQQREQSSAVARNWRYNLTPAAIAERFVTRYRDELVYVLETGAWRVWSGIIWEEDLGESRTTERMKRLVLEVSSEVEARVDDETMQKIADRKIAPLLTHSGLRNLLALAARQGAIQRSAVDFDANPYLLNLLNCTIDLRTGTAKLHDPLDLITKVAGAGKTSTGRRVSLRYDPNARCPRWDACLREWFPIDTDHLDTPDTDTIAALQERAGYWLSGSTKENEYVTFFNATGRNGKGVFKNSVLAIAGDYGAVADPSTFVRRGEGTKGSARGDLAPLMGARVVFASEPGAGDRLDEEFVKMITGNDAISFRPPYGKASITFKPSFKLVLLANHPMTVTGADSIWDRQKLVVWRRRFEDAEQDRDLEETLVDELPGILNWCLEGYARYYQRGRILESKSMRDDKARYKTSQKPHWLEWVEDRCVLPSMVGDQFRVRIKIHKGSLFNDYLEWCASSEIERNERLGRNKFYSTIINRFNLDERNEPGVGRVVVGITTKTHFEGTLTPVERTKLYTSHFDYSVLS